MSETNSARPLDWDPVTKTLHWAMALLIPVAWLLAVLLENVARENRGTVMFFHKSFGVLILLLLVVRVLWRLTHVAPATETTRWEPWASLAAKLGHGLLYVLMVAVPIGGAMTSITGGRAIPFFGLVEIASPFTAKLPISTTLGGVHELFGHLLLIVAFGHAVVGILHHAVLKDRTLLRMKPFAGA